MKFLFGVFKFIFGLLIFCAILVAVVMNLGLSPVGPGAAKRFHVTKGENGHDIAQDLQDQHLVRNALLFQIMLRTSGKQDKIVAGDYMLKPSDDPYRIIKQLVSGESIVRMVTFTEGQTAEQMAHKAAEAGICTAEDYLKVVHDPPADLRAGLSKGSLEGYLFPDTY
ncbi:MAG TPA: endolytic transglycosylase MltG, partial [Candidatus Xenobia bacterium]